MSSRLARTARHLLNRHNLTCAITLLAFVASSVGIPAQPFGQPTSGCRCGEELQASGQCCCKKSQGSGSPKSCCAGSAQKTAVRSCCENKTALASNDLTQPILELPQLEVELAQPKSCCCKHRPENVALVGVKT